MRPDPYDGSEDWDSYQGHFECCATLGGWSEREKALTLAALLRGQARSFYMGLGRIEKANYLTLTYHLQQRFGRQSRHEVHWLSKFDARFRNPEESAASLADDLLLLARKAYPGLDDRSITKLAMQQFYKSLEPELKWRCIERDCRSLAEAVELVDTYEIVMNQKDVKRRTVRGVHQSVSKNDVTVHDDEERKRTTNAEYIVLQQILERLEVLERDTKKNSEQAPLTRRRQCYVCTSDAHIFRDCPVYKKCQQLSATNRSNPSRSSTTQYPPRQPGNFNPPSVQAARRW